MLGAALVTVLCGSASAGGSLSADRDVPPKPDYCKTRACVLGCMLPGPFMGSVSTNVPLCNRLGRQLYWFVRAR